MTTRPPADDAVGRPRIIRLYLASNRFLGALTHLVRMLHIGVWLGILTRPQLHAASEWRHDRDQRYRTVEYNNSGLFAWERTAIDRSFAGCRRLLVTSAGGGREVIALRQRGFEIEAFESDPGLLILFQCVKEPILHEFCHFQFHHLNF